MNEETTINIRKGGKMKGGKKEKSETHPFPFKSYEYCKVSVVTL